MLKYSVVSRKNPINKAVKYYAQLAPQEPLSLDTLADMIAANCTLTRHDIVACLSAFQEQLIFALRDGKSVRLGDLGIFRVTLRSFGSDTKETFNSSFIHGISCRFCPSSRIRKALKVGASGVNFSHQKAPAKGDGGNAIV